MKLYKYTEREWAESLIKTGSFRIGTLYDYRKEEEYGKGIGDKEEGKKKVIYDLNEQMVNNNKEMRQILKSVYDSQEGAILKLPNVIKEHDIADCYIYSLSTELVTPNTIDAKYDTCIEIIDNYMFIKCIAEGMASISKIAGNGLCEYRSRTLTIDRDRSLHPAFIKDPTFKQQKEFRIVFEPNQLDNLEPHNRSHNSIGKYCKIYEGKL